VSSLIIPPLGTGSLPDTTDPGKVVQDATNALLTPVGLAGNAVAGMLVGVSAAVLGAILKTLGHGLANMAMVGVHDAGALLVRDVLALSVAAAVLVVWFR
jgi:hypothetical protein